MKTMIFILIFLSILFPLCACIPQQSTEVYSEHSIYVDDDNTNGPWDGSIEHPFQFIQQGINASLSGDIIQISEGIYRENIVIDKQVQLLGSGYNTTISNGCQSI
jgi:hypothetical protein